jgi:hypothetical protein
MTKLQPRYKYYLRKDRHGDITCAIEVLGLAEHQGMVRVYTCTTRSESVTEYRLSLFDNTQCTEQFFSVDGIDSLDEARAMLVPTSYWVSSEICDLGSVSRMVQSKNVRYRTNDLEAVTIIKTVSNVLEIPVEIIICDWPSYRWEDPNKSIDVASAIWTSALDHCIE